MIPLRVLYEILLYKLTNVDNLLIFVFMMEPTPDQTPLYTNAGGTTYQCDRTARILVEFGGGVMAFKIRDFLIFKRKVDSIDLHAMIFNLSDE
ncbi:MAG: hypothetical protein U0X91_21485 [Spirosomataceae bacterium]